MYLRSQPCTQGENTREESGQCPDPVSTPCARRE